MQPDVSFIPHSLAQVFWIVLASSLAWLGGWLTRRKREPHEIAKISAETRQINIGTDVSLIQAATTAITKAERLQQERDHWELKAFDNDVQLKEARAQIAQMTTQARLDNYQIRRQMAFIEMKNLKDEYLALDTPRRE